MMVAHIVAMNTTQCSCHEIIIYFFAVTNFSVYSTLTGVSFITVENGYAFYNCSHASRCSGESYYHLKTLLPPPPP